MEESNYISGEQLRKYLHFSKRKIAYLIQNGHIKAIDTKKETHRYLIKKEDAEEFKKFIEENPFFLDEENVSFTATGVKKTSHCTMKITKQACKDFKVFLTKKWQEVPNVLFLSEAGKLVGVSRKTLACMCERNKIVYMFVRNRRVCTKESLIEYYSTEGVLRDTKKSQKFKNLITEFNLNK